MKFHPRLTISLFVLASCGPQSGHWRAPDNSAAPVLPAPSAPTAAANVASTAEKMTRTKDRTGNQKKGSIDPKSIEAAGEIVQHYAALIEEKRFPDAARLWGDAGAAASFARDLDQQRLHLEIGALGETEGAAGSIFTSVPVVFAGKDFRRPATIILRRVNDVPGSTDAERRWHIERIEWDKP